MSPKGIGNCFRHDMTLRFTYNWWSRSGICYSGFKGAVIECGILYSTNGQDIVIATHIKRIVNKNSRSAILGAI